MKRFPLLALAMLSAASAPACGGGGGAGGPRDSARPQTDGVLATRDLGRVDARSFRSAMDAVVAVRFGHTLGRSEEQLRTVTYEFEWESRDLTPEGRSAGYMETRYRIIVQGRRGGGAGGAGTSSPFRFNVRVEYQARDASGGAWRSAEPLDPDLVANVERMLSELQAELPGEAGPT